MDRDLLYVGQIGLVENQLNAFKSSMIAVGIASESILGQATQVYGLTASPLANTVIPGSAFSVSVGRGAIFSYQETDPNPYGVLGTDLSNIVKIGINLDAVNLAIANSAPAQAGFSINYLISAQFQESDSNTINLPFYNANGGPTISAEYGTRTQRVVFSVTAGVQGATGSQTTPSSPAGSVPIYIITITNGQTGVVDGNIAVAPGAPFVKNLPTIGGEVSAVTDGLASEVSVRQSQAGNLKTAISVYSATALSAAQQGSMVEIAAGNSVTTTLPSPVGQGGAYFKIYNGSAVAQGIRTAGSIFIGPGGNNSANVNAAPGQLFEVVSDNSSWVTSEIAAPMPRYSAYQAGSISPAAAGTSYNVASVSVTFPPFSRTGSFRVLARLVNSGSTTATGNYRQNFVNNLFDGTNGFQGAAWLCSSYSSGDTFGFSDTILTNSSYLPNTTTTFTMSVTTYGGDTKFTISGSYMELYIQEA